MSLRNLHELNIISIAKKEQALAWMIANGPVLEEPALPLWILKALVAEERILRVRRGLYVVPTKQGEFPTLPEVLANVEHGGYVSGRAALGLAGVDDQEIGKWWVLSGRRQGDLRYGRYVVHFVYAPDQARTSAVEKRTFGKRSLRVATVAQAIVDEFRYAPFGVDYATMTRIARRALLAQLVTPQEMAGIVRKSPSTAIARRAGFLLDLLGAGVDPDLLAAAKAYRTTTDADKFSVVDSTWHLALPSSRTEILRAAR